MSNTNSSNTLNRVEEPYQSYVEDGVVIEVYNPYYGDYTMCACGHVYCNHFLNDGSINEIWFGYGFCKRFVECI
jgi:hypothetical protein